MKVCYKWSEKRPLSHCVFGNMQIFSTNAKGFESEEKVLRGRDIDKGHEEIGWEFAGNGI